MGEHSWGEIERYKCDNCGWLNLRDGECTKCGEDIAGTSGENNG